MGRRGGVAEEDGGAVGGAMGGVGSAGSIPIQIGSGGGEWRHGGGLGFRCPPPGGVIGLGLGRPGRPGGQLGRLAHRVGVSLLPFFL